MSAITASSDDRFSVRSCPLCGSDEGQRLFNLRPDQFCSVNPTYDQNVLTMLHLKETDVFPVVRCKSCEFVYARLLPTPEFLKTVYEKVISFRECCEHSENNSSYARRMKYTSTLMDLKPESGPLSALDFGAGLGVTQRLLSAVSVHVVAYDPSPIRAQAVRTNNCVVVDSLEEITQHGPYDLLICDNVLEHVPDPKQTVSFLASVCKRDSVLFVSVPSYEAPDVNRQLTAIKNGQPIDMTLNPWEHLNYFTLRHLDHVFASSGFAPIRPSELPGHVNIGLRPESSALSRFKNGLASGVRLMRYMTRGAVIRSVENAYYKYEGALAN